MLGLIDNGIRSIRSVTNDLRPSLLDDLGLLPALRSLVAEFAERSGMRVELDAPATLPPLSKEAELAVFRALQEALANVLRHAQARVGGHRHLGEPGGRDAGGAGRRSRPHWRPSPRQLERGGHMGLAGMRERIGALGGTVRFGGQPGAGALLEVRLPAETGRS